MAPKGIYRTKTEETGAEYACVDYGTSRDEGVTKSYYEEQGYQPPFDELPTKEDYDAANSVKK